MNLLRRFTYWHEAVLAALLVALLLWARSVDPVFTQLSTQSELATHVWELAILALPMLLIIITGGIDLSVGSGLALCAVAFGMVNRAGAPLAVSAALALAVGAVLGALNGFFVAKLRVHPLIVTLATLAAFRGMATGISLARPMSGFPDSFQNLATNSVFGLPLPGWLFVGGLAVTAWVLAKTPLGRSIYAIGHNETAARFSGLRVDRIKWSLYALSGLVAGLAAVCLVARRNTAKADLGTGLELEVITAVVLGGTSINGGRGNVVGLLLGVALIHETREFVAWRWHSDNLNAIVIGTLLVVSVLLYRLLSRRGRTED